MPIIHLLTLLLCCSMSTLYAIPRTITLVKGDILAQQFDVTNSYAAIVNAANNHMQGGSGIDGAITKQGGVGLETERIELAKKFNVPGYPTIVLTTGGKDIQYEGGPSADSLKTFLGSNL
mgnify:CR=1 FL=1